MATVKLGDINNNKNHVDLTSINGKVEPPEEKPYVLKKNTDPRFDMNLGVTKVSRRPPVENNEDNSVENKDQNIQKTAKAINTGHVDLNNMTPISTKDILPSRKVDPSQFELKLMNDLDEAVERTKKQISEDQAAIMEKIYEEKMNNITKEYYENGEDEQSVNLTPNFDENIDNNNDDEDYLAKIIPDDNDFKKLSEETESINIMNEDSSLTSTSSEEDYFKDENENDYGNNDIENNTDSKSLSDSEDNESEDDADEVIKDIAVQVKEKVSSKIHKIDLSRFKISKKPVSAIKAMKVDSSARITTADWILPAAGRPVTVTGLTGSQIIALSSNNSNKNRLNTFRDIFNILYNGIVDPNKPDFESWLKTTRFSDVQHLYFAYYIATFSGSNFVHYTCTNNKCKKKVFIKDIAFKDMIKYKNEQVEKKYKDMLSRDTTSSKSNYSVDLTQISDYYVVGLRSPSIWNVVIETASLSDSFIEKYGDLIDTITYIEDIYMINYETNELELIDTKPDKNNQTKTAARKIRVFNDILKTLSPDQFVILREAINNLDDNNDDITYQVPAVICPCCATEIKATDMDPDTMLFTRHQLGAFASMPSSLTQ